MINEMGDKVNKAQKQQAGAPTSSDYQQAGLKVLARLIARLHMEKTLNKKDSNEGAEKD